MIDDLERLKKTATEKGTALKDKRNSLEELPKIVREIEEHIRKGYSLFFETQLQSKKELVAISNAPSKLQVAYERFKTACLSEGMTKGAISLSVQEIDDSYKPRKAGLIYPFTFTVYINMRKLYESRIESVCSVIEMEGLKQLLTTFSLTVVLCNVDRVPQQPQCTNFEQERNRAILRYNMCPFWVRNRAHIFPKGCYQTCYTNSTASNGTNTDNS